MTGSVGRASQAPGLSPRPAVRAAAAALVAGVTELAPAPEAGRGPVQVVSGAAAHRSRAVRVEWVALRARVARSRKGAWEDSPVQVAG